VLRPHCWLAANSLREDWAFENRRPPPCRGVLMFVMMSRRYRRTY
jgi:hypothetical protein